MRSRAFSKTFLKCNRHIYPVDENYSHHQSSLLVCQLELELCGLCELRLFVSLKMMGLLRYCTKHSTFRDAFDSTSNYFYAGASSLYFDLSNVGPFND